MCGCMRVILQAILKKHIPSESDVKRSTTASLIRDFRSSSSESNPYNFLNSLKALFADNVLKNKMYEINFMKTPK